MRVVLDACVIFPTVMREMLLGVAAKGLFEPIWSERILEEWVRATRRLDEGAEEIARGEAALMRVQFPNACVEGATAEISLPDPDDVHVLASAITAGAEVLVTRNLKDFPTRFLGRYDVLRRDPDGFLLDFWQDQPDVVAGVAGEMHAKAEAISGRPQTVRGLLKRAGMPRLGKALS